MLPHGWNLPEDDVVVEYHDRSHSTDYGTTSPAIADIPGGGYIPASDYPAHNHEGSRDHQASDEFYGHHLDPPHDTGYDYRPQFRNRRNGIPASPIATQIPVPAASQPPSSQLGASEPKVKDEEQVRSSKIGGQGDGELCDGQLHDGIHPKTTFSRLIGFRDLVGS
jgi:hypothetical protein